MLVSLQQVTKCIFKLLLLHERATFLMETHGQDESLNTATDMIWGEWGCFRSWCNGRKRTFFSMCGIFRGFPFWSAISRNGVVSGSSLPSDKSQHHVNINLMNKCHQQSSQENFHDSALWQNHLSLTGSGSLYGFSGHSCCGFSSRCPCSPVPLGCHSPSEPSSYCGSLPPAGPDTGLTNTQSKSFSCKVHSLILQTSFWTHLHTELYHSESVWWISDQTPLQFYKHTNICELLIHVCVCVCDVCLSICLPVHQLLSQNIKPRLQVSFSFWILNTN